MRDEAHVMKIAGRLGLSARAVKATAGLLDEGATIPFIARYRKEVTGSLDEVAVAAIRDHLDALRELDKRRESVLKSLEETGHLTPELKEKICAAGTLSLLEDLYLPYRPKRRTRAALARGKGLEPLARTIFAQGAFDVEAEAARFVDGEKGVASTGDALAGARDIIAEWVSEDERARTEMRALFSTKGLFRSKAAAGKEEEGAKFRDYFDWSEPVAKAPSHRVLALRRGESQGVLILHAVPPEDEALALLEGLFLKGRTEAAAQVRLALHDAYRRLLSPAMETELEAGDEEEGRPGGDRPLQGEPEAAPPRTPSRPEAGARHRPGLSDGVQGRLPRRTGKAPPRGDYLSPQTAGAGCRGGDNQGPLPEIRAAGRRHREWNGRERNGGLYREAGAPPGYPGGHGQ